MSDRAELRASIASDLRFLAPPHATRDYRPEDAAADRIRVAVRELLDALDAAQKRADWLVTQIEGCIDYADRLPGQGPGDHITRCLRRDLEDALRVARSEEAGGTPETAEPSLPAVSESALKWSARLRAQKWESRAVEAEARVGRLEEALRAAERLLNLPLPITSDERVDWLTHKGRARDLVAAALAGGTPPPGEQDTGEAGDAGGVRAEASEPSGGSG